jgi:hypothetical protein
MGTIMSSSSTCRVSPLCMCILYYGLGTCRVPVCVGTKAHLSEEEGIKKAGAWCNRLIFDHRWGMVVIP